MLSNTSEDLKTLINAVQLTEIGPFELVARRGGLDEAGERRIVGPGPLELEEFTLDHSVEVFWSDDGDRFIVRLLSVGMGEVGELSVGLQAEYVLADITHDDIPTAIEQAFVNEVAVLALAPFVREAVADISRRVFGTPINLGVLHQGELEFRPTASA